MLNSPKGGQRYEVINMGIAGGALDHYLAILLAEKDSSWVRTSSFCPFSWEMI